MSRQIGSDNRLGQRYLATIEVRAEWDEPDGGHVITEGITENVGPEGTLIHLPRKLPEVGSRVRLELQSGEGKTLQVIAEVLRLERNPSHPLAALSLLGETDEWRGLIWEPAAPKIAAPPPTEDEEEEGDEPGERGDTQPTNP